MTPCYTRHETAPGVHVDIPHEHERYDMSESKPAREVLDGIRGRLTAATPGPWFSSRYYVGAGDDPTDPDIELAVASLKDDATFIAAAPTDVARLVSAVEAVLGLTEATKHTHRLGGLPIVFVEDVRAAIEAALKEGE